MVARMALAGVAVVAAAWFAVLLVDQHTVNRGFAAPAGGVPALVAQLRTPARFNARVSDLRRGQFLNPDAAAELQIAVYLQIRDQRGDLDHALRIAETVVRREPENVEAWVNVSSIQRDRHDLPGEQAALGRARRLDPIDFRQS